jgi:hypothetical protein
MTLNFDYKLRDGICKIKRTFLMKWELFKSKFLLKEDLI